MARARNIKPKFFTDAKLGKADPCLMILFASLWCLADREGRLEDEPDEIWAQTFPYRPHVKTDELLNELQQKGFIIRYEVDAKRVIQVKKFKEHQTPHIHEKKSVLPQHDANVLIKKETDTRTRQAPDKHDTLGVVKHSDSLIPDSLIPDTGYLTLIPDTGYLVQKQKRVSMPDFNFEDFWRIYPKRPGANKTQALKAWVKRLEEGEDFRKMQNGAYRYMRYCQAQNTDPQYIKQAATFLGPDRHYLLDWVGTKSRTANQAFADRLTGRKLDDDDEFTLDK